MTFDLKNIRAETPGVQSVNHLLACGSALMPQPVLDAMVDHLTLEARIGGYEAHAHRHVQLDLVYDQVAGLIGAKRNEIALVENATVGWCQAFYALPMKAGDRILTCEAEYAANYVAFLQRARRDGVEIVVVPSNENGALDVLALENLIDERTVLIAMTWVPTNGGLVNPAAQVGKIANRAGVPFLLDACQAVGQMPVNVGELGCDFLSATGRKFLRGPRGTGFLYVRESLIETLEPVVIDHFAAPWVSSDKYELRPDARRFENWENAYALRAGLGAAIAYAQKVGVENIQAASWGLAARLRQQLSELDGAQVLDIGDEQCAIVSFSLAGVDPDTVVAALKAKGICIGTSTRDSTLLDSQRRTLPTILRAAPHYYNTEQELDDLVEGLAEMVRTS
ncbi:probable class-V aminotransferase [hydrothermal vent metagenome]|uniref:Probable class-V aminotransferase n=1 Tax=hydrothermal vent metagenome TaxID=652676 RepID=A0A3B0R998_9ZZZZ